MGVELFHRITVDRGLNHHFSHGRTLRLNTPARTPVTPKD
jgi:hypothetical protein